MLVDTSKRRSVKFHHIERLKKLRKNYWRKNLDSDKKSLSKVVNTPNPCSCFMCSNRRTYEGVTRQELKSLLTLKETNESSYEILEVWDFKGKDKENDL